MDLLVLKDIVYYGIIGFLILLSIISLTFFIERLIFFKKVDTSQYKNPKILENALTKHLTTIGSIASNAPYIGLLGTVLAIMITFASIGNAGLDAAKIMSSIALALKTTAVGLVVAICSMFFYNILVRYTETILAHHNEEI
jgi:biopolymer transport protein ExbB